MRILVAGLGHETNTFAARRTGLDDFVRPGVHPGMLRGDQVLERFRGTGTAMGGIGRGLDHPGVEAVGLVWAHALPGGVVEQDAYLRLSRELLEALERAGPVGGVVLDLHGAMVTEGSPDAEGDLLGAVRRAVGDGVVVGAVLDFHANLTPAMVRHADFLVGYDTYPHVDMAERGEEVARLVVEAAGGGSRPARALVQLPLLSTPPGQRTSSPPMAAALERAHRVEGRPDVTVVTLAGGFPSADVPDAGTAVLVAGADARGPAEELARSLWEERHRLAPELPGVEEAVVAALAEPAGPVVLADGSDNPGGGAPGDGTALLAELLRRRAEGAVLAVLVDPEAVRSCRSAGEGRFVDLMAGGKTDDLHGGPVRLRGTVVRLTDGRFVAGGPMNAGLPQEMGGTVVVRSEEGVEVVLTERRIQPYDPELLRSVGIEPGDRRLLALKSAVHFRAAYQPLATRVIEVDAPGICSPDLRRLDYRRLRRPVHPLDPEASWEDRRVTVVR